MTKSTEIKSTLKALNIKTENAGTSTGSKWTSSRSKNFLFSPVDGAEIASVSTTSIKEFEAVVNTASTACLAAGSRASAR